MQYALVDGIRSEALPTLAGYCPACSDPVLSKCGQQRLWHWSHRGKRNCDPWWERETPWHRAWKREFPLKWQEAIHLAETDEKHIADVKTPSGFVIEFQHSSLSAAEKTAREAFYRNMVWVVDAARLKNDRPRFLKGFTNFRATTLKGCYITAFPNESFTTSWLDRSVPVVFDFGSTVSDDWLPLPFNDKLWCLLPGRADGHAVVTIFGRHHFTAIAQKTRTFIRSREIIEQLTAALERQRMSDALAAKRYFQAGRFDRYRGFRQRRYSKF